MSDSQRAAITNWVWLADLAIQRDALLLGEHAPYVGGSLEQHFETVRVHAQPDESRLTLPFSKDSFDCVVIDHALGERALSEHDSKSPILLETKRVLRSGGCAFLPIVRLAKRRPHKLADPLRRCGFAEVRPFYVFQSFDRPSTMIPATRRAAAFFESWAWGGIRGRLKATAALASAHHLTQAAMFFLAYP